MREGLGLIPARLRAADAKGPAAAGRFVRIMIELRSRHFGAQTSNRFKA
jgi:hypothetical protein